jgi:hypothetical protein
MKSRSFKSEDKCGHANQRAAFLGLESVIEVAKQYIAILGLSNPDQPFNKQLALLEEDLALTKESLQAKDSLHDFEKQTVKLAKKFYSTRLYHICLDALDAARTESSSAKTVEEMQENKRAQELLGQIMCNVQAFNQASFYTEQGFKNPYPEQLLFSQKFHGANFSNKSGRENVQGKSITEMAQGLENKTISPDSLRVNVYLERFNQEQEPRLFAYNNRTWATFCRAKVPPTRLAPVLPSQDLRKRIYALESVDHSPNLIYQESSRLDEDKEEGQCTLSMKPSSKYSSG